MKKLFSKKILTPSIPALLIVIFFLPSIFAGKIPIPADSLLGLYHPWRDDSYQGYNAGKFPVKNPLITDPILQTYPWGKLVIDNFKSLNFPLWNPYSFSGQPLLANIQSAPFRFTNLLFFVFPFNISWTLHIILPLILTGSFMFIFLRSLNLSILSSTFGAIVLPFSGYFVAWMTWGGITATAMFLPLILFCINKLFEKISPVVFIILFFSVSQTILSGHWQTGSYIFLTSILFTIFKHFSQKSFKPILIIGTSFVLGIVISSVQILPSLEFLNFSIRDIDQAYFEGRRDWFIPYQHLIQIVAPDFFGNPSTYNYWGIFNYGEFVGFFGIIPLILAGTSVFTKGKSTTFFLTLLAISLILGLKNPVSEIPYAYNFTFISNMQPSRIIFLLVFSLTVLAAIGFETILKEKYRTKFGVSSIVVAVILLILLLTAKFQTNIFPNVDNFDTAKIASRNLFLPFTFALLATILIILLRSKVIKNFIPFALVGLTMIELFRFAYKFTPFSKPSLVFPSTGITNYLSSQERPFRVITTDRRILPPNISAVYQIESIHGYDPLFLNDYANLVSTWESNQTAKAGSFNRIVTPTNYDSKLADFLNVKYILTFDNIESQKFNKVFDEGKTKLYENKNVLPRVFFVSEVVKVENRDQELQKVIDENFDLSNSAVSSTFSFEAKDNTSSVLISSYQDQSLVLNTNTQKQAPLVLSNVFYPGWNAFVDGHKTEVKRVNFMFQSVVVPEGKHTVEFKYQPKSFYNGLYISALGLFLTIISAAFLWSRKSL